MMQFLQEEVYGVVQNLTLWHCMGCAKFAAVVCVAGESVESILGKIKKAHGPKTSAGCNMYPFFASQSWQMKEVAETVVRELRRKQLPEIVIDEILKEALDHDEFEDRWGQYYKDWARLALYPFAMDREGLINPIFSSDGELVLLVKELRRDDVGPYTIRVSVCKIENKMLSVSDIYVEWRRIKPGEDGRVPPQYHRRTSGSCYPRIRDTIFAQLPERYRILLTQQ